MADDWDNEPSSSKAATDDARAPTNDAGAVDDSWGVSQAPTHSSNAAKDSWGVNPPKGGMKPPGGRGRGFISNLTNHVGNMKVSSDDSWGTSKFAQEPMGPGNPDPNSSWVTPQSPLTGFGSTPAVAASNSSNGGPTKEDDDWDAAPRSQPRSMGRGFSPNKQSSGGWGSSPKKSTSNGWGKDNQDEPRGANWGSSQKSSSGGWGGGQEEQPRGAGWGSSNQGGGWGASNESGRGGGAGRQGGGSRNCYNCNQDGHMSRDCPQGKQGGGGGPRNCYNCNQEGHMSKDCPNPKVERNRGCRKCGQEGHMARECPNNDEGNNEGNRGANRGCYNCGEEGHQSKDCEKPRTGKSTNGGACHRCQSTEHMVKDCPQANIGPDGKERENYIPPDVNENELFSSGITTGNNFSNFENVMLQVTGNNVPDYITSFETAGLRELVLRNVKASGYVKPTPVQKGAMAVILARRDLIASAVTGSGKTAAFLIPVINILLEKQVPGAPPAMVQKPEVVIVSPTRELAIQIHNEARKFAHNSVLKAVIVYGGTQVSHQRNTLTNGCNILVATPGRLKDFVDKEIIDFSNVQFLILDEADRMLDMGFGPAIEQIAKHPTMTPVGKRMTLMFSATFPDDVQRLAQQYLHNYIFVTTGTIGGTNPDVQQEFHEVPRQEKRSKLMEILRDLGNVRIIVFVESKKTADFIAAFLANNHLQATSIHGDRLQSQREQALREFKSGVRNILVATNVAARGLDIAGVEYVINYDLPSDVEEYVHRVGRTGRVGNVGRSISFFDPDKDGPNAGRLVEKLTASGADVPTFLQSAVSGVGGMGFNFNAPSNSAGGFRSLDARRFGNSGASDFLDKPSEVEERWE